MKRFFALALFCILLAGIPGASAETDAFDISIGDDTALEMDIPSDGSVEDFVIDPDLDAAALTMPDFEALSAPEMNAAPDENDSEAIGLSISKSTSKTVNKGFKYQIEVPGKKIRKCRSSDKNNRHRQ